MSMTSGGLPARAPWKAALTHPCAIASLNLVLLLVLVPGVWELVGELRNWSGDDQRVRPIVTGLSSMLIGYGVVVEERAYINERLGLYPAMRTPEQEAVDRRCHSTGFATLALALVAEVLFQIVDLPNTLVNTKAIDWLLLLGSTLVLAWICVLLIIHTGRMVFRRY
jgi:hypothetical protein